MEEKTNIIRDLSIEEREEIFVDIARTLEDKAREALVEGNMQFAALSNNMAEAIRVNADELARDDPHNAELRVAAGDGDDFAVRGRAPLSNGEYGRSLIAAGACGSIARSNQSPPTRNSHCLRRLLDHNIEG
ncbi:Tfp pilus assembly protein PilV [Rhizobium sp. BK212]|nr:Tfp pilus assembly protein PilV [Rhizobium sp. BK212]